ncbi:hypothetical protein SPRG_07883 [Saprolegnia parasitica CBS 223.65]|uniref:Uncharacterized protein n=1 Tax=Saprolegnia parasitica (strain CBS 223.65) TaxID=695850 RepID=A0A067CJF1_SAPPC|nr:hypothetical protein SPRG_07883 [Saprolegnia parasitica CBS 223.65]KDO26661.1 hypothetical protein SPRG_07883 [Saprolegnia parasitica CBS 223.65]|eukprot:XP_012202545.1 hypothetical protein SPRG_07883 [Saprolegnia parasitica CBS 223.65]
MWSINTITFLEGSLAIAKQHHAEFLKTMANETVRSIADLHDGTALCFATASAIAKQRAVPSRRSTMLRTVSLAIVLVVSC